MMGIKTAVLGFGNPCRSDDAVGIYVVNTLADIFENHPEVSVFDMGTSAFEVLFKIKGHQRIIMIDAVVNTGEQPGTLFQLPYEEIQTFIIDDPLVFLHSLKWDQALSYAKKMMQENFPEDIQVFLVAVNDTRLEIHMSEEVQKAGDILVEKIKHYLQISPQNVTG